jgi:Tol biopolymer transport system component
VDHRSGARYRVPPHLRRINQCKPRLVAGRKPSGIRIESRWPRLQPYQKASNGGGQDETVLQSQGSKFSEDWSRDGRFIIFGTTNPKYSLWALPVTGDKNPIPLVQGQFNAWTGRLSPDGRWLAYVSDESARNEIYVIPFSPESAAAGKPVPGKWQISTAGGVQPQWRGDGRELLYT